MGPANQIREQETQTQKDKNLIRVTKEELKKLQNHQAIIIKSNEIG